MKLKVIAILSVFILFLSVTNISHAQDGTLSGTLNDVSVSVTPDIPGPNENVTLTIESYIFNMDSADISWTIDGKMVKRGTGAKSFSFTTKDVGQPTVIDISILPVNKYVITKHLKIIPASMDVLWEAEDSAVPPFYKGKALPTEEAKMKFVAIPNMKTVAGPLFNPNDVVYKWSNNYSYDQTASGYGKDYYEVAMNVVDQGLHIDVDASTRDGSFSSSNSADTKIYDPKILFYAASPLYGPDFSSSLNNSGYTITSQDVGIFAEPYFISPADIFSSNLSYAWQLNGDAVAPQNPPNIVSIHRNSTQKGDAVLSLTINNSQKLLQQVSSSINLQMR